MAKILVVEDEPDLRRMIVDELTDEGHVTIEAGNGREGLEKVAAEMPDLVLSDITMPQMNGYQFLRAFKENHPEHAQTPFIFLTALANRDDELKGLRLGVDDYISKPIDFDLLLARVELGLRRHRASAHQVAPLTKSSQPSDSDAQATGGKINDIITGNDGLILTGKFETISLEAIKEKAGERWAEMSERLLTHAKAAIQDHLGPRDVCRVTASEDFVVCFADLTDEQIDAKVRRMGDAIWDRLFGVTDDEDLSHVDAQAFEIHLASDGIRDVDATFNEIEELIEKQKMAASHANLKTLKQIFEYEDLFALTLLSSKGKPSTIKMLSFEEQHETRIRTLFEARHYDSKFLLELQQRLFERLKERPNLGRAFRQAVMLLPIHFAMIRDDETRAQLIELCHDLKNSI
ncbi:MAG: response regulator transcription factor, partial [Pseudomonadota bacterium]